MEGGAGVGSSVNLLIGASSRMSERGRGGSRGSRDIDREEGVLFSTIQSEKS